MLPPSWRGRSDAEYREHLQHMAALRGEEQDRERRRAARQENERMAVLGFDIREPDPLVERMAAGITARLTGTPPPDKARLYTQTSFAQLALACLLAEGNAPRLSPAESPGAIISHALSAARSDFPAIVGSIFERVLLARFEAATPTYRALSRGETLTSFRPSAVVGPAAFPELFEVGEAGEVTHGQLGASSELIALATFSRTTSLSLQLLADDDAGVFANLAGAAAERIAELENRIWFESVLLPNSGTGATMADGQPLFHSSHANVGATGVLSETTLGSARALVKNQTRADGTKPNADAAVLLVAPESETLAEKILATLAGRNGASRLRVLSDAHLSGSARFYLFADPQRVPVAVHATLGGGLPRVVTAQGWERMGVDTRVSHEFAAGPLDYRGAATGAGA